MTASRTPAHVDAHAGAPPPGRWPLPRLVTASAGLHVAALGAALMALGVSIEAMRRAFSGSRRTTGRVK